MRDGPLVVDCGHLVVGEYQIKPVIGGDQPLSPTSCALAIFCGLAHLHSHKHHTWFTKTFKTVMFYSGGLQAGISLAVTEGKAVVCFVRDDEEASRVWEDEYFKDDEEFARFLETRSVLLRLTKGSHEAGYLTSFCPIVRFPAVVVIKNGMLREYLVPEISKNDFRSRLRAALDDTQSMTQNVPQNASSPSAALSSASSPSPAPAPTTAPASTPAPTATATAEPTSTPTSALSDSVKVQPEASGTQQPKKEHYARPEQTQGAPTKPAGPDRPPQSTQKNQQSKREQQVRRYAANIQKQSMVEPRKDTLSPPAAAGPDVGSSREASTPHQPSPPKQYRLQVRLFDGSSVRNSFAPSQTIRADVRPWLDGLLQDEKRPYNLKHILTPLPNRTLTIADEERTLEDLGLGSTANLVMIPIHSYTEAYNSSGSSLPVRAAYSAYGLLSSAVGTATGLVGSFIGYNPAPSDSSGSAPTASSSGNGNGTRSPQPAASSGPRIRTLRDQREERNDSQFYNGNQLNFEPRRDTDAQ